jgi:hypothetical protein
MPKMCPICGIEHATQAELEGREEDPVEFSVEYPVEQEQVNDVNTLGMSTPRVDEADALPGTLMIKEETETRQEKPGRHTRKRH